jgi:hypothetical protein
VKWGVAAGEGVEERCYGRNDIVSCEEGVCGEGVEGEGPVGVCCGGRHGFGVIVSLPVCLDMYLDSFVAATLSLISVSAVGGIGHLLERHRIVFATSMHFLGGVYQCRHLSKCKLHTELHFVSLALSILPASWQGEMCCRAPLRRSTLPTDK